MRARRPGRGRPHTHAVTGSSARRTTLYSSPKLPMSPPPLVRLPCTQATSTAGPASQTRSARRTGPLRARRRTPCGSARGVRRSRAASSSTWTYPRGTERGRLRLDSRGSLARLEIDADLVAGASCQPRAVLDLIDGTGGSDGRIPAPSACQTAIRSRSIRTRDAMVRCSTRDADI